MYNGANYIVAHDKDQGIVFQPSKRFADLLKLYKIKNIDPVFYAKRNLIKTI